MSTKHGTIGRYGLATVGTTSSTSAVPLDTVRSAPGEIPMKCPKCQTENLSDAAFCEECGAPLETACPTCGAGNRPTAKFCRKCRAPLTVTPAAAPALPQLSNSRIVSLSRKRLQICTERA